MRISTALATTVIILIAGGAVAQQRADERSDAVLERGRPRGRH